MWCSWSQDGMESPEVSYTKAELEQYKVVKEYKTEEWEKLVTLGYNQEKSTSV